MLSRNALRLDSQRFSKLSEVIFAFGLFVSVIGAGRYLLRTNTPSKHSIPFPSSITERRLAISSALRNGETSYNFSTNFTPGVGTINNPEAYLQKLKTPTQR